MKYVHFNLKKEYNINIWYRHFLGKITFKITDFLTLNNERPQDEQSIYCIYSIYVVFFPDLPFIYIKINEGLL